MKWDYLLCLIMALFCAYSVGYHQASRTFTKEAEVSIRTIIKHLDTDTLNKLTSIIKDYLITDKTHEQP